MENDARKFPRYEVEGHNLRADLSTPDGPSLHDIQNLSLGGICIQTKVLREVGETVDVVLRLRELGQELRLRGEVVWVNRTPPQDVGIRWVDLDGERRAVLGRYLEIVTAAPATPGA
jgi:hypothetical protein